MGWGWGYGVGQGLGELSFVLTSFFWSNLVSYLKGRRLPHGVVLTLGGTHVEGSCELRQSTTPSPSGWISEVPFQTEKLH